MEMDNTMDGLQYSLVFCKSYFKIPHLSPKGITEHLNIKVYKGKS